MPRNLKSSAVFNNLIMSDKLNSKLNSINFKEVIVPASDIASEMSTIERRVKHPTRIPIMDLYSKGKFIIINDRELDLPTYLSTIAMKGKNNEDFVLVDISKFTTSSKSISSGTLYALLQNAMITYKFNEDWNRLTSNASFIDLSANIYSQLSMKVLDKLYSINLQTVEADFVAFLLAKFFLINMAERNHSSTTDGIAHKACFNETNLHLIKEKEDALNTDGNLYKDLMSLFQALNSLPEYNIKFRSYFENFVRMYGDSTVMAMDYLPAFYQMIFSVAVTGSLNKEYTIEKAVGKPAILKCYSTFSRIV